MANPFDLLRDIVDDINSLGTSSSNADPGGRTVLSGRAGEGFTSFSMVFPFTPMVNIAQAASYAPYNLTHTNYSVMAYSGSPSPQIQVTGQFANHTTEEHEYTLKCINFLRTVTKMHYGKNQPYAGTPPPVCRFSSHGKNMFNNVPVVVTDFSMPLENNVDQIEHNGVWLPAILNLTVSLMVHVNPAKQKNQFSLTDMANGTAAKNGFI